MNYGQSESRSEAYSGLRGTQYEGPAADEAFQAGRRLTQEGERTFADPMRFRGQTGAELLPGGRFGLGAGTDPFTENYGRTIFGRTGVELLPSGRYGLGANADPAVEQFGKYLFGNTSASMAARGRLSPENQAGVVGSAITNALPSLIPGIQQWQQAQYGAVTDPARQFIPSAQQWQQTQFAAPMSLNQYALNAALTPANYWQSALGAKSLAEASAFNFGVSGQGAAEAAVAAAI